MAAASASQSSLTRIESSLEQKFSSYQTTETIDTQYMQQIEDYIKIDRKSHETSKGVRGVSLMPEGGECGLHWSLCPNMCNLEEMMSNYFSEIVGNKMEKYQEWKTEVATKQREITEDLKGKLDQVEGLEDDLGRAGLDLEKRQELFLSLVNGHLERANAIHESLLDIQEDFNQIGEDLTSLSSKVVVAHDDCYEQAPCFAVPKCKLGVASGSSCSEIAQNAMDLDEQGEKTLNMDSAVHIIQPDGLEPKAAICNFDYTGTGYTVVQNRHNDTGSFNGDFENGFGTTVGYDDAECGVANYYLGNKYIRAITESDSSLKVKHSNSVDQWNKITLGRNALSLTNDGKSAHVCGDEQMTASSITLGNGGINGEWTGPTQVMIGFDMNKTLDSDCMFEGDYDGGYSDYNETYVDKEYNY